jgi:hypothetical protein
MVSLFTYELNSFIQGPTTFPPFLPLTFSGEIVHDMVVDQSVGGEVDITLDVTFHALPCICTLTAADWMSLRIFIPISLLRFDHHLLIFLLFVSCGDPL